VTSVVIDSLYIPLKHRAHLPQRTRSHLSEPDPVSARCTTLPNRQGSARRMRHRGSKIPRCRLLIPQLAHLRPHATVSRPAGQAAKRGVVAKHVSSGPGPRPARAQLAGGLTGLRTRSDLGGCARPAPASHSRIRTPPASPERSCHASRRRHQSNRARPPQGG
jgi:hypothetical protein